MEGGVGWVHHPKKTADWLQKHGRGKGGAAYESAVSLNGWMIPGAMRPKLSTLKPPEQIYYWKTEGEERMINRRK